MEKIEESLMELKSEILGLRISCDEATQAFSELRDTIEAQQKRYHPLIYWFLETFERERNRWERERKWWGI